MESKGKKQQNIAHFNNKLLVNLLIQEPLSCIELAEKTKLTHTSTKRIVDRLLNMNLIKPYVDPNAKKSRGRQHFRYEINAKRAYFACVSFQHSNEFLAIFDLMGNNVYMERFESGMVDNEVIDRLIEKLKGVLKRKRIPLELLAVISVAIPGRADSENGNIIVSSKIQKDVNLKERFKSDFPSSLVYVNNDSDFGCLYSILSEEFDYGKGVHLYLFIDAGVSCCVVFDRKIILGSNGFGGEIGMNRIDGNNKRLHDTIGTYEMLLFCRKVTGNKDFSLSKLAAASEKYPEIKNRLNEEARFLGITICNLVNVLGCSHIIFSGTISKYPSFFFDSFLKELKNTNYSEKISYKIDFSNSEEPEKGQLMLARLNALDWVMEQY